MLAKGSILVAAFMFVFLFLHAPNSADASGSQIKSAGCKTEFFLLKELAQEYQKKTGTKLRTAKTGNKKAIELMLAGDVDFAFTCKPLAKLSKKLNLEQGRIAAWKSIPIAKDPIIIVSNVKNGVEDLSIEELTAIFNGKASNWSTFGGANLPIRVAYFDPSLESGSTLLFKEFTVGIDGELIADAKLLEGPTMLGNYVARTAGGVTFMPLNSYQEEYGEVIAISGVKPSQQTVKDGSYSLTATYHLTVESGKNEAIDEFISYCMSPEGQRIIARNFVPYAE